MRNEILNKMDRFINKTIEQQTIYEIYRACRLCGAGGGYKMPIIQSVLNIDGCDVELKQKIRECVQIEVHQDDKMPPLICELCVDKVNDFYEFLEMCRQTNKRTRLRLGLPPQMLPRGAPDAGDCILGVTEPIYVNNEDSNEPLSAKRVKGKGVKVKKEPEKEVPRKEVRIKLENNVSPRGAREAREVREVRGGRGTRQRQPSPPRLRDKRRGSTDNVSLGRLQSKIKSSVSPPPPPKSILKRGQDKKREPSPPPAARLKRSREAPAKQDPPAKRVKIETRSPPTRGQKASPPPRVAAAGTKQREAERRGAEQRTPCAVCRAVFKTPQAALSHRRSHVVAFTNPKLACNACEAWFASADETAAHHRRHRRHSIPYNCNRCSTAYKTLDGYDENKIQAVEMQYTSKLEHAEQKFEELQTLERNTGTGLIYSKKGKPIADKTVQRLLTLQKSKTVQISALWLRYIRVRNAVTELEAIVRKLEMLAPGLYVAQYEQLHIDNQNYMTKIEERDDELIKNRTKCTEHNQILAHIREKMHHTNEVIDFRECDLGDAEIELLRAREDLGQVKSRRDKLRWALQGERLKAGLLTRKDLLRDFQHATDEVIELRAKKELLEAQIAKTTKEVREARKRILLSSTSRVHNSLAPSSTKMTDDVQDENKRGFDQGNN